MTEKFRPIAHYAPNSFSARIKFYLRMILDFQFATIYRHLKPAMALFNGKMLDIGAGNSPYKHLLKNDTEYFGIDIKNSDNFGYTNNDVTHYDGKLFPFEDETFNNIICTEVLEHVEYPELLISETYRVLKPSGIGIFTIPWSARFHYDYHRYTPSMLKLLFKNFSSIEIIERGSDTASIVAKIIVLYFRNLTGIIYDKFNPIKIVKNILVCILLIPLLIIAIPIGLLGVFGLIGSMDDPLGYTIIIKK